MRETPTLAEAQRSALQSVLSKLDTLEARLPVPSSPPVGNAAAVTAARRLNSAAGSLAVSVLLDSAVEHWRGQFRNPAMHTPLAVSALTLLGSAHGMSDRRGSSHRARDGVYAAAALTGVAGTGFHLYNVLKRPERLVWQNLFYGAPLGAPMAIFLAGALGVAAERVRDHAPGTAPRLLGVPAGRALAALSGIGILGTVGEAGMLHFRGAFQNPAMFLPVTVPPVASALLAGTALGPARRDRWLTRWWLRLTTFLGVAGVGVPCLGRAADDGRLAQLEPEHPGRAALAGAARLHRPGARRAGRPGLAEGPPRCVTASPAMT